MSYFSEQIMRQKYSMSGTETWNQIAGRVAINVLKASPADPGILRDVRRAIQWKKFMPGGRYLYAAGREYHQTQNCLCLRAEDSREGWADLLYKSAMALMTGAGIGIYYGGVREEGSLIKRTGGIATGPIALMHIVNESSRNIQQGGNRRGAVWAGLPWSHPDAIKFLHLKDWSEDVQRLKEKDFSFPAPLDGTNISIVLDEEFFEAYNNAKHAKHAQAHSLYHEAVRRMCITGEPGFSVNVGENSEEVLRNACGEATSADDSDVCNLGSINIARVGTLQEFTKILELGIVFLLAGSLYSDVPYEKVKQVRKKNRRIGLGIMGFHEWFLQRGKRYGPDDELALWLKAYAKSTAIAKRWANAWGISAPIKTRAIAPNGTVSIVAETTPGIEPIFCVAYKRRYLKHQSWHYQYVIDPTAKRFIDDHGIYPDSIEDAYILSDDVERRLEFQAFVQQYVDHGISSTINLPPWGSAENNENRLGEFANLLMKYLPKLRGITCYPDGGRDGQPIIPISYAAAHRHVDRVFTEKPLTACELRGGSCGD